MPYCIVQGCPSGSIHQEEGVILHVFPPKKDTIKLWLSKINQDFGDFDEFADKVLEGKKSDKYRICSKHFSLECYYPFDVYKKRLRPDAVPSIFNNLTIAAPTSLKRSKKRPRTEHDDSSLEEPGLSEFCKHCKQRIAPKPGKRSGAVTVNSGKKDSMTQTDPKMGKRRVSTQTNFRQYHKKIQCRLRGKKDAQEFSVENDEPSKHMGIYEDGDFQEASETERVSLPLPFPSCSVTREPSLPKLKRETLAVAVEDFTLDWSATGYKESVSKIKDAAHCTADPCLGQMYMACNAQNYSRNAYNDYVREKKFIVFESCLDSLLMKMNCQKFSSCNQPIVHIEKERNGSYISVYGTCARNHRQHLWQSQPKIREMPVGNLLLSSAILCSGSSYAKTERFLNLLGVLHIDKSTYETNQQMYLYPTINQIWEEEQQRLFAQFGSTPLCVAGDGRCDRYGGGDKYCLYSLMEVRTKKILTFNVELLRPGFTYVGLKKIACDRAIQFLIDSYVNVQMFCTERHVGIRKMLREKYGGIIHKFDAWHLARSIGKKLVVASRRQKCTELADWVVPIKAHLWWCATTCEENANLLVEKWNSLVHHVVNNHSWNSAGQYKSCAHNELSEDMVRKRPWIRTGTTAHKKLKQIVLNKKLQKDLRRLSYFCHPGEFQVFHSVVQKYHPKRVSFPISEVSARTQLSVLDYNNNVHHPHGLVKQQQKFSDSVGTLKYSKVTTESASQEFIFSVVRQVLDFASGAL